MNFTPQDFQEFGFAAVFGSVIVGILWYLITFFVKSVVKEIRETRKAVGKTMPTPSQIATIMRNAVWKQSEPKLDYLRKLLIENSIHEREERLRTNIKTELLRQSTSYINFLNEFYCDEGLVGDYVANEFPMNIFLEQIFQVFFEEIPYNNDMEHKLVIERKINDIRSIMLQFQNEFVDKFYNKIK